MSFLPNLQVDLTTVVGSGCSTAVMEASVFGPISSVMEATTVTMDPTKSAVSLTITVTVAMVTVATVAMVAIVMMAPMKIAINYIIYCLAVVVVVS